MSKNPGDVRKDPLSLKYWQAVVAFGQAAVEETLRKPDVFSGHRELIEKLYAANGETKREIILPGDLVFLIVGHPDCNDGYYADPDGRRLYSVERRWRDRIGPEARGHTLIENTEALAEYGAYCIFMASDRGIGYKGEKE
jgi:hypothetical protein